MLTEAVASDQSINPLASNNDQRARIEELLKRIIKATPSRYNELSVSGAIKNGVANDTYTHVIPNIQANAGPSDALIIHFANEIFDIVAHKIGNSNILLKIFREEQQALLILSGINEKTFSISLEIPLQEQNHRLLMDLKSAYQQEALHPSERRRSLYCTNETSIPTIIRVLKSHSNSKIPAQKKLCIDAILKKAEKLLRRIKNDTTATLKTNNNANDNEIRISKASFSAVHDEDTLYVRHVCTFQQKFDFKETYSIPG